MNTVLIYSNGFRPKRADIISCWTSQFPESYLPASPSAPYARIHPAHPLPAAAARWHLPSRYTVATPSLRCFAQRPRHAHSGKRRTPRGATQPPFLLSAFAQVAGWPAERRDSVRYRSLCPPPSVRSRSDRRLRAYAARLISRDACMRGGSPAADSPLGAFSMQPRTTTRPRRRRIAEAAARSMIPADDPVRLCATSRSPEGCCRA